MNEDEQSAKKFKSHSLDEVLEIFSTFSGSPRSSSSIVPVIKQEIDEDIDKAKEMLESRYSHILVKETLVDEDDGANALVGETQQQKNYEMEVDETSFDKPNDKRSEVLEMLDQLKGQLHTSILVKDRRYKKIKNLYDDLRSKSTPDEEWERKADAVIKSKQEKILELEKEMEHNRQQESLNCGQTGKISINNGLFKKITSFLTDEKERANSIKGLLGASVGKLKGVKDKEEQLKNVKSENDQLRAAMKDLEFKCSEFCKKVEMLTEEIEVKDKKIVILNETNANLEQEVTVGQTDMENSRIDSNITREMQNKLNEREFEIANLNKKLKSLSSETEASQTFSNRMKTLLNQTEKELTVLKEKQSCHDELLKKYECRITEKDQEIINLKQQKSLNDLKTEYKRYFDELEQKAQQFMALVKKQQDEIKNLNNQISLKEHTNLAPVPFTQPRFLRPVRSQVPDRVSSAPPPAYNAYNNLNHRPPLNTRLSSYDQAPRYFSGHVPQQQQVPQQQLYRPFRPSQEYPTVGGSLVGRPMSMPPDFSSDMSMLQPQFSDMPVLQPQV